MSAQSFPAPAKQQGHECDSAEKYGMINNGIAFKLNSGKWRIIWMEDTDDIFFYVNDFGTIVHLDQYTDS